jgi:cytoskeletal protein RodZ
MKFKTFLVAATAGGIGYVLGTKAGRARFEQIRGQAQDFLKSPTVQDTVANLSDTVKQSAGKLPDPVANVVSAAADKVKSSTAADSTATDSDATGPTGATEPTGATFDDAPVAEPTFTESVVTDPISSQTPPQTPPR